MSGNHSKFHVGDKVLASLGRRVQFPAKVIEVHDDGRGGHYYSIEGERFINGRIEHLEIVVLERQLQRLPDA